MAVSIEAKYNQLVDENATLTRVIAQLKAAVHEKQIALAASERKYILRESQLSEEACARINAAFSRSTNNDGIKQAINCEKRGAK